MPWKYGILITCDGDDCKEQINCTLKGHEGSISYLRWYIRHCGWVLRVQKAGQDQCYCPECKKHIDVIEESEE